jgi:hypothetical protein
LRETALNDTIPLALFVYNRPGHTARALKAIGRLQRLSEIELHVFSDAPKHEKHAKAVDEVRQIIRAFASTPPTGLRVHVVERAHNLGLAGSIAGSVTELVRSHGRVIVLEDDLVPTPDFLPFMLDGLRRYQDDPRVMQISGCLLPGRLQTAEDGFFLPLTTTWGWATWERAWSAFKPVDAADRAQLDTDPALRSRFTAEGRFDYVAMLDDLLAGRNDSWGIQWWYAVAKAAGLVLYPRESLIWNGGFDASGVHCGGTEIFQPDPPPQFAAPRLGRERLGGEMRLPAKVLIDKKSWAKVLSFLEGPARPQSRPWHEKLFALVKSFRT